LVTSIALVISLALQHRSPWPEISKHLRGASFEPSGVGVDGVSTYQSLSEAIAVTVDMILEMRTEQLTECLKDSMVESSKSQTWEQWEVLTTHKVGVESKLVICEICQRLKFKDKPCPWCETTSPLSPTPSQSLSEPHPDPRDPSPASGESCSASSVSPPVAESAD